MTVSADEISASYHLVKQRIAAAASRAGRDPESIRLVVVTKGQPLDSVRAVIAAGARILGENYAEEAVPKIQSLGPHAAVEWHMIGHVQSRKAEVVVRNFRVVQTLDSVRLARRLDRAAQNAGRALRVLLEFNVGGETTKSGWPASDEKGWRTLLSDVSTTLSLAHLRVAGVMAIPPLGTTPEDSRPYFRRLMLLKNYLNAELVSADFSELSFGTSFDYEVAVEEGATMIRVGTAILGPRPSRTELA